MINSVDPDQTVCSGSMLIASILHSSVMLGNHLQQTTSAENIFRCIFFLCALRVNCIAQDIVSRFDRAVAFSFLTTTMCKRETDVTLYPVLAAAPVNLCSLLVVLLWINICDAL